jgi:hypothetical protein
MRRKLVILALLISAITAWFTLKAIKSNRDTYHGGFERIVRWAKPALLKSYPFREDQYFKIAQNIHTGGIYLIPPRQPHYGLLDSETIKVNPLKAIDSLRPAFQGIFFAGNELLLVDDENNDLYVANEVDSIIRKHNLGSVGVTFPLSKETFMKRSTNYFNDSSFFNIENPGLHINPLDKPVKYMLHGKDGGMLEDGFFTGDSSHLFYIPWFSNYYYHIAIDNDLNVSHTTITSVLPKPFFPQVKVFGIKSRTYVYAGQVRNVNLNASVYKKRLLIQSNIKDDNLKGFSLSDIFILDCYDATTGKYQESFCLKHDKNQATLDFTIHENKLYLLFKDQLCVFDITSATL